MSQPAGAVCPAFQHTAARRRLASFFISVFGWFGFQHTAARRRLVSLKPFSAGCFKVSTHSRPKAAGPCLDPAFWIGRRFNTQPPEGGWGGTIAHIFQPRHGFNTQPPEGGWGGVRPNVLVLGAFQHTAARRRLVVDNAQYLLMGYRFNTQPPEGGWDERQKHQDKLAEFQHTAARRRLGALSGAK